jgi:uncharacterized membrane protein YdjX (TVP38/TMEM64 family)
MRRLWGWRRVLFGASLVVFLAFLVFSDTAHATLLRILEGVKGVAAVHSGLAAALVVLFSALAAMVAFLSSWLVIPFAVHTWGTLGGLLLVWGGWVLGGAASYAIGNRFGAPVVRWLGFDPLLARYEELVSRRTPFALAFLFQLALPSEIRGYLFGLGRYPLGLYLLSLALAELPFGVASVYLGRGIVQQRVTLVVGMGLALVVLSVWAFHALHRRLAAMHRDFEEAREATDRDSVTPAR